MPLQVEGGRVQVLGPATSSNAMGMVRRARELSDIAPQYVAKSGLCNASELESSRGGSIRIQHVTGVPNNSEGKSRFPKLDECAHFHYEHVEIGPLQVSIVDDDDLKPLSNETDEGKWWSLSVTSQNKTWLIRRSYDNFRMLDQQLHRCIYDRKFSELLEIPAECIEEQENIHKLLSDYVKRFSAIAGSLINCGPVLNWLELDNRGHRLLVPDTDNCPINTPAVAAAYSVKRYTAQAPDEISFEVGDMISVIDMPPPEESIWWRGKRGFQVGFFPCECVAVIGDKVPRHFQFSPQIVQPTKPVLRKHGKLIAFFRSFILSRPSRRRLKQSGILKERVFGCDLGEHLLNSGHEIPMVLKCCVEFIETHGLVDGIYRLSGVTSNIQKLRNAFDEDRVPALYEDESILQDVHSVASLLKMYFRELPNPLCTYQLYHQFVGAVQATQGDDTRLLKMRDVVQKLPPPHYRTLEYLMKHLVRVSEKGHETGMTSRNIAIVWAPNLLRCKELEVGGVAALQGVGVQAVVTEFLICYSDLIFCDRLPNFSLPPQQATSKKSRPKSLAISTPTKLLSLEEARNRALLQAAGKVDQDYIEVGGGPANLPAKYHTVIELPANSRKRLSSKRSPIGWKMLFGKSGRGSQSRKQMENKVSNTSDIGLGTSKAVTELDLAISRRRLRPAKSAESLSSNRNSASLDFTEPQPGLGTLEDTLSPMLLRSGEGKSNGHNRSVSHESYFDQLQDQKEDTALDISEIQLNFDLEESEMRIFSEDETLMSVGSGSLTSNNSPLIHSVTKCGKNLASSVNKRLSYTKLAVNDDKFRSSQSADPSPKKQKTNDCSAPRSKLEEQLSSSVGDIQFIDSVSPDQVLVQAEVHLIQSPSPVSSISQISSLLVPSSPILPHIPHLQRPLSQTVDLDGVGENECFNNRTCQESNKSLESFRSVRPLSTISSEISPHSYLTSPSLAEATISDNESLSLHSSELTTPETPICRTYNPLIDLEESGTSNMTTPEYDVKARKSSSETDNLDRTMVKANLEFDNCQNIGKEFAKFEEKVSSDNFKHTYENITASMLKEEKIVPPKPEERKPRPVHPYENIPLKPTEIDRKVLETSFDFVESFEKTNKMTDASIKYELISTESSCDSLINVNKEEEGSQLLALQASEEIHVKEELEPKKEIESSEMNLLKECSEWLQTKQEFCAFYKPTSTEFSSDWFQSNSNDLKIKPDTQKITETSIIEASPNLIENLDYNREFDNKGVSECDELTKGSESLGDKVSSSASVETVFEKKMGEHTETSKMNIKNIKEMEGENSKNIPVLDSPEEKKLLETNLDDFENIEWVRNQKPIPKKRTSPQKSSSSGNVRQLLSKFEMSPTSEKDLMDFKFLFNEDKLSKDADVEKNAKKLVEERPKTLERLSTRRRTNKDFSETEVKLEKSKSGSHIDEKNGRPDILLKCDLDLSDPQRRERIEKYKEKRRNYLREKYRSDSFKNEKDDFVLKVKQRHTHKRDGEGVKEINSDKNTPEKPIRKIVAPKSLESPSKESNRRSFSAEVSSRFHKDQPNKKNDFLRLISERKSASDFRSAKCSPEKKNHIEFSGNTKNERLSPEFQGTNLSRRRMTDPSRSVKSSEMASDLTKSLKTSINKSDRSLTGSSSTPTFCIKDMAALFEKPDDLKTPKQYLSSV